MAKILIGFVAGIVFPVFAALLFLHSGLFPIAATDDPSKWEAAVARGALKQSLSRAAVGMRNPLNADAATLEAGKKLYGDNCAGCHGERGQPSAWGSTSFYPRVPQFWRDGSDLTTEQMFVAAKFGIRYTGMGAWQNLMKDEDIWKVVTFIHEVRNEPKKEAPRQPGAS